MNNMIAKMQRFGRVRQLHTIISRETVVPSSPTPPHLKIHNLSPIDYIYPHQHIPFIFFYRNYNNNDINVLKKSLSQSLTQYYPFAGRLIPPHASHIECNDKGVEFLETSINSRVDDYILKKDQDETLNQLIPNVLGSDRPELVAVQLNHFTCGGAAVAVSASHKIADALTTINFISHWATVARGGSPVNPIFLSSTANEYKFSYSPPDQETNKVEHETRRFLFPNSKLNELKNKVNAMGTNPINPSRVESLISLLFKCVAITKEASLQPSVLHQMVNLRKKMGPKFPESGAGNLAIMVTAHMMDSSQIKLNEVITSLRKPRFELEGARDVQEIHDKLSNAFQILMDDNFCNNVFSSVCRFPIYEVDFGWGKPLQVMISTANAGQNLIVFMDSATGDGIEATVNIKKEEMAIFQKNQELLAYVQDIY